MKKTYLIVLLLFSCVLFSQNNYNRTWATYFGGSGFDVSDAVTDRFGNLVVSAVLFTGGNTTISNDVAYYNQFKTATGLSYQTGMDGGNQSFVAKFSPDGTLLFATYLPYGIVEIQQNKQNKWVIRGQANQTNLGTTGTWLTNPSAIVVGSSYSIITQLSEDFTTEWFSYIPNTSNTSSADDFYLDDNHNIYLFTNYSDTSFPNLTTPTTFQPNFILEYDVNNDVIPNGYLCKLNNLGQQQWGTFLGLMSVNNVLITNSELVITGIRNENLPAYNNYYCTETNCDVTATEYIFTKFDPNTGQRIFSKYIPSNVFIGGDMVTDGSNFYVLGPIDLNNKITLNAYQASNGGIRDLYLAKYNSNFQLQWATYIGGSGFEYLNDYFNWLEYKEGYLYLSAWTESTNNFITSTNSYSTTKQGSDDNFIMKFSADGALVWGSYYGGLGYESSNSEIVATSNESFYICGSTTSTSAMTTPNCHQENMNIHPVLNSPFVDKWNCYIAKFTPVVLSSDSFAGNAIQIYPNPSNGIVTISGGNLSKEKHKLSIYNELGQQVYNKNMALFNEYTINLSHLSKGIYFITMQSEESNLKQTEKLIIK